MNRERILRIADDIEHSASFDQSNRLYCGTPCCIAAYAIARYAPERFASLKSGLFDSGVWQEVGMEVLDIGEDTADKMFY